MHRLLLSLLLIAQLAHGQERIFGQDMLAAQHPKFDVGAALQYVPECSALGTLDFTFGTSLAPITRLLASGKFSFYRVHIINGSCIANRNCGPYDPFRNYSLATFQAAVLKKDPVVINFITNRVKRYCDLQQVTKNVTFRISPVLEHRLNKEAYRITADTVLAACPGIGLVNNAVTGDGERYKGAWRESHDGIKYPKAIVSFDGKDATDANIPIWVESTDEGKISFVWSRGYNCRAGGGAFTDPRKRTLCPKARDFELLAHITDDRGEAPKPSFSCKFEAMRAPFIWKPLAESYEGSNDPRQNLPVAIVPMARRDVQVVGVNGKFLGNLRYYGQYQGNLNRYYSGTGAKLSGYEFEKEAVRLSASPYVWLRQSGRCIGPFVPGQRAGSFR